MTPVRVVDLSVPLDESTQVYPGDPHARMWPATTIAGEGYNVLHVQLGSQTGTHVDAPYHVREDGLRIDQLPLERFIGPLVLVEARGLAPRTPIGWKHLAGDAHRLRPGVVLVLHTGWSAHRGTPAYFAHPFLDADATRRVLGCGVRTIGLDAPSLDETTPDGLTAGGLAAHQLVAAVDGVIIESLTGLQDIRGAATLSALPLRLTAADGAPCRAVALEGEQ